MSMVINNIEYITPDEACQVLRIRRVDLDHYYADSIKGLCDMPCITNPAAINAKGLPFKFGARPNYLLPKAELIDWFIKRTPRV